MIHSFIQINHEIKDIATEELAAHRVLFCFGLQFFCLLSNHTIDNVFLVCVINKVYFVKYIKLIAISACFDCYTFRSL